MRVFRKTWYKFLIIAVTCFLVYAHILFYSVTGCDDMILIKNVYELMHNGMILEAFQKPYIFNEGLFYRPIVTLSFVPDLLVANLPSIFHLFNIIYLIIACCLFNILLINLSVNKEPALLFTLLFAIHPIFTNSVAWIPGRNDLLLIIFVFAFFISLIKYIKTYKIGILLLNLLFFSLALFTKETALAIPVIGTIILFLYKRNGSKNYSEKISLILFWFLIILIWFYIRENVIIGKSTYSLYKNLGYTIQALGKLILPVNLSVLPTVPDTSFFWGIIAIIIVIFSIALSVFYDNRLNKNDKHSAPLIISPFFGLIWFIVFLLPSVMNINPEYSSDLMVECRLILPLVGIFILIANLSYIKNICKLNFKILSPIFIVSFLFIFLTIHYSSPYKNEFSFWQNAVEHSPNLDLSYSGLGLIYQHHDNYEQAEINYKKAGELNSTKIGYNSQIAYTLMKQNKIDEAEFYYEKELLLNPDDPDANLLVGVITFKKGDLDKSEKYFKNAAKNNPNDVQPSYYFLKIYYQRKNFQETQKYAEILKSKNVKIPDDIAQWLEKGR